ncbi:Golgi CORVET complex core vacuolar protein 8-domain-containing protein [Melampsora americana]|nr:Golgi CORVET complex core vacuolar protein 8-domain-containing protein [Melampsora americana]
MTSTTSHLSDYHLSNHLQNHPISTSTDPNPSNLSHSHSNQIENEVDDDHQELINLRNTVNQEVQKPYQERFNEFVSNPEFISSANSKSAIPLNSSESSDQPELDDEESFVYTGNQAENSTEEGCEDDFVYDGKDVNVFDDQDLLETDYATKLDAILELNNASLDDHSHPDQVSIVQSTTSPSSPIISNLPNLDIQLTPENGQGRRLSSDELPLSSPASNGLAHLLAPPGRKSLTPSQSVADSSTSSNFLLTSKLRPASAQFSRLRSLKGVTGSPLLLTPPRRSTSNSPAMSDFPQDLLAHHRLRSPLSPTSDLISRNSSISHLYDLNEASSSQMTSSVIDESTQVQYNTGLFHWASLRRISSKIYPNPKRNPTSLTKASSAANTLLGLPTVIAASGVIVIGTAKGWAMVFDYASNLKCVLGTDLIVRDAGAVSSLAISHDHTFVAVGHTMGYIYLYDLAKSKQPVRSVIPTNMRLVQAGRSEGHLTGHRIIHLGFVGLRHTAIVSADESGLAFYHHLGQVLGLASTDVIRILGKYPDTTLSPANPIINGKGTDHQRNHLRQDSDLSVISASGNKSRKSTKIFGSSPLPLGPSPHPTDEHSLVALLTPTKLIIIGLKPSARTWWRCMRNITHPDQLNECGSLCWFPCSSIKDTVDLKRSVDSSTLKPQNYRPDDRVNSVMDPLLAFSWGKTIRFVTVMSDEKIEENAQKDELAQEGFLNSINRRLNNKVPNLRFVEGKSWTCESTVQAIQWLNWRIICVLTSTHIEIIDTQIWRRTGLESIDSRGIVKLNVFRDSFHHTSSDSKLVLRDMATTTERLTSGSLMGSFKAYKGKIFLLTTHDLRLGMVVSWADQILQLVETGSLTKAIDLTTSYWFGRADLETIGLPSEDSVRQALVKPKLKEIMLASLDYIFSDRRMEDDTHYDPEGRGVDRTELFQSFVRSCAKACIAIEEFEFIFEDVFERYSEHGIETIFLEQIGPFIISSEIDTLPTLILQHLISLHQDRDKFETIEQIIWHVDPSCLDIHQVLDICSRQHLYDALVYVYTEAMGDFVGPLIEFVQIIRTILHDRQQAYENLEDANGSTELSSEQECQQMNRRTESMANNAYKVYAYLTNLLTGMSYPNKKSYEPSKANLARMSIYQFLFSGQSVRWPMPHGTLILTVGDGQQEPTYPYLRMLLKFDSEALLDTLDGAFEDSWLHDHHTDDSKRTIVNRQFIVNLLLEVISTGTDFSSADRMFFYIFVARNLPKYSQFLHLSSSTIHSILVNLSNDIDLNTREDRELAVEFLLSVYNPPEDLGGEDLLEMFEEAGFWRILRNLYRAQGRWDQVLKSCVEDPECGLGLFIELPDILKAVDQSHDEKMATQVDEVIMNSILQLIDISLPLTSSLIDTLRPSLQTEVVAKLDGVKDKQFDYLRSLLEPRGLSDFESEFSLRPILPSNLDDQSKLIYVNLLCEREPSHVLEFLKQSVPLVKDGNEIVNSCTKFKVDDGLVWQLDQVGKTRVAFHELNLIMKAQTDEIVQSVSSERIEEGDHQSVHRLISSLTRLALVAMEICVKNSECPQDQLTGEDCWFNLLSSLIRSIQTCASVVPDQATNVRNRSQSIQELDLSNDHDLKSWVVDQLRSLLPTILSSLISHTNFSNQISFSNLVRRLIESSGESRIKESSDQSNEQSSKRVIMNGGTNEFRSIVMTILDTYRFEGSVLEVTSRLIDRDLFEHVKELSKAKQRGIRPGRRNCYYCKRNVWGEGSIIMERGMKRREEVEKKSEVIERLGLTPRSTSYGGPIRKKSLKGKEVDLPDDFFSRPGEQYHDSDGGYLQPDHRGSHHHASLSRSVNHNSLRPPSPFALAAPPRRASSPGGGSSPISRPWPLAYERFQEDLNRIGAPGGSNTRASLGGGEGSSNQDIIRSRSPISITEEEEAKRRGMSVDTGVGLHQDKQNLHHDHDRDEDENGKNVNGFSGIILGGDGRVAHEECWRTFTGYHQR